MHRAAYILAGFALLSQLLALVRDRLLASSFGAGQMLDIYYAAFRVPDLLFATIASLLSLYALLPILSRYGNKEGEMVSFLRHMLLLFFVAMAAIAAVLYALTPYVVSIIAPGIVDGTARADLIALTRILLLQPILLGASNVLAALTQLRHRFFLYSISPLLYNIGIIGGIVFLYPSWGISGLGWGVVLGALMHLLVQAPFFAAERSSPIKLREVWRQFVQVMTLSVPRTLALGAGQISLLVLIALASFLLPGSIAVFMFAWNLQAVPLTIIGVSYSVAAFPTLARLYSAGERREFISHIEVALRHMLFWSIPAIILIIVLRAQLVRVVLGAGMFDWEATRLTAAALALFVLSLFAQSVSLLVARAYYAAGRTGIPLMLGLLSVLVTCVSAFALLLAFESSLYWRYFLEALLRVSNTGGTEVLMLALAYSLGVLAQAVFGLLYFARDFDLKFRDLWRLFIQSASAAVVGGAVAYGALVIMGEIVDINTLPGIFAQGAVGGFVGLITTAFVLHLLKNPEIVEAYTSLRRRLGEKNPPVAVEPTEVSS